MLLFMSGMFLQIALEGKKGRLDPERILMSLPLGCALIGVLMVVCLIVFDFFFTGLIILVPAALSIGAVYRIVKIKARPAIATNQPGLLQKKDLYALLFSVIIIIFMILITASDGARGDYLSIWSFKSLVLNETGTIRTPSFQDFTSYHHHQDYPVLFPCIQTIFYRLSNLEMDRTVKLLYPLLLGASALCLYFHLRKRDYAILPSAAGSGFCLLSPALCGVHPGICSAYMDIPLGCFILLAFLSGMAWLQSGRAADGLKTGLFIAAMFLTKNEGIAAAGICGLLFIVAGLAKGEFNKRMTGFVGIVLPVAIAGSAWLIFRKTLPPGDCDYFTLIFSSTFIERLPDLPSVIYSFLLEFIHFERWGFLWILIVVAAPWTGKKDRLLPFIFIVIMVGLHVVAVMVSPLGLDYQTPSALSRIVGQAAPLGCACIGIGIGSIINAEKSS